MIIAYSKRAIKTINALDSVTKQRIKQGIDKLPRGDTKLLAGNAQLYRLRVGDWRVLFSYPDRDTILIEKIAPRGEVYKGV